MQDQASSSSRGAAIHPPKDAAAAPSTTDGGAAGATSSSMPKKPKKPHHKDPRSQSPSTQLSRALSYLLRHGAEKEKLAMGADGWVALDDVLLKKSRIKSIDMDPDSGATTKDGKKKRREPNVQDVLDVVNEPGDKQRFQVKGSAEQGWFIRAIQGHTIEAVKELDHTPITLDNLGVLALNQEQQQQQEQEQPPSQPHSMPSTQESPSPQLPPGVEILHGTTQEAWSKIQATGGLSRMKRNHIHLARGRPGVRGVGSGMRATSPLLIHIDIVAALKAGVVFELASNGAVLTAGGGGGSSDGELSLEFVSRVEDRSGKVIWTRDNLKS